MSKVKYDFVYLTNTPSFYKLNLCNEIAKTNTLLLVFYGYGSEAVNVQLEENINWNFDYTFLNKGDSHKRCKIRTFLKLVYLMGSITCKKVLFAGWASPEYNIYSFISPKKKNVIVCESSIIDVSFKGLAGIIKKLIIKRMSAALPSGSPHAELFKSLNFKGTINMTGGVGIFNYGDKINILTHNTPLKYIYVGRLVNVKNIELLIEEFNRNGKPLTIVGKGPLESELKKKSKANINFIGYVENTKLGKIYQENDVFILPSKSEVWGLVVEEAIYWGLPVIVSDKVGCSIDMVKNLNTGVIFKSNSIESLDSAIIEIEKNYNKYKNAVLNVDFEERDKKQVKAYTKLI